MEADTDSLQVNGAARTMWFRAAVKDTISGVQIRMDCAAHTRSQLRHRTYNAAGKVTSEAPASGQAQPLWRGEGRVADTAQRAVAFVLVAVAGARLGLG